LSGRPKREAGGWIVPPAGIPSFAREGRSDNRLSRPRRRIERAEPLAGGFFEEQEVLAAGVGGEDVGQAAIVEGAGL